jgi:ribosomal protein S12 methylthiotransferase accessory factor YcaO
VYRSNLISLETSVGKSRASGNGKTQADAEAGAFCETLERYSSIFREDDRFIIDSFDNLKNSAINPNSLTFYSKNQYKQHVKEGYFPLPFETSPPIAWSEINDSLGNSKLMPTQLLYMGGPKADLHSQKYFKWNTNGTAAGSSPVQAKLLALYELIERDAMHIWWFNKLPARTIYLNEIEDDLVHIIDLKHKKAGETLLLLDISQDITIKTVAAVSSYLGDRYFIATGSDVDIQKACAKAARELSQVYFYFSNNKHLGWPRNNKSLEPFFLNHSQKAEIKAPPLFESLSAELLHVENCILNQELKIYYKDFSRQDVELSVFKAIVPKMRNQYRQLGPGRLYDVPEKLYATKNDEKDLNAFNLN